MAPHFRNRREHTDLLSELSAHTELVPNCLLCSSSTPVQDPGFEAAIGLRPPFHVQRCPSCGLRWLSPRPDAEGYRKLYSYKSYFGGPEAPEAYPDKALGLRPFYRKRLLRVAAVAGCGRPLHILDVGAATGDFVAEALASGHNGEGVEISPDARQLAQEHNAVTLRSDLPKASEAAGTLDVIHLNHVLEHLPSPLASLEVYLTLLRPGGLLVVEVPQQVHNHLDRVRRLFRLTGSPVFDVYSLHHTYFFTPATLESLLKNTGFVVERLVTASSDRTPLAPFTFRNFTLRLLLGLFDMAGRGGNIIEAYGRKNSTEEHIAS